MQGTSLVATDKHRNVNLPSQSRNGTHDSFIMWSDTYLLSFRTFIEIFIMLNLLFSWRYGKPFQTQLTPPSPSYPPPAPPHSPAPSPSPIPALYIERESNFRYVRMSVNVIKIFLEKMVKLFANSGDPDQIRVCTVCQLPFLGSPCLNGFIHYYIHSNFHWNCSDKTSKSIT